MKSALLVVLLAVAASAAVVSHDVPDVLVVPDVADVDMNEIPEVIVTDVDELTEAVELIDEAEEPEQTAVATRRNLNQGSIGSGDRLVYNSEVRANGVAGHFHVRDIRINTNRRVSAIRVNRVGASQNATPSIIGGGIGSSFVTIRIRSAVGRGYHYRIQVYVR
uniref:HMG176 isoform F n=1 Tax=Mamestra configurata TaxID=174822 RepID=F6K717_9NEOP|nr:HMG176 isoform F [Mamestra configurata]